MRAHTATHLLHAQLSVIFPQTKQAGSWVGEDQLRFDFAADRMLTPQEIDTIQATMQDILAQDFVVTTQEMSYTEAVASGAKAFFEEKYADTVRVVSIVDNDVQKQVSVELCGGLHVASTGHIGAFCIVKQEAVASGIKRITAMTGPRVVEKIFEQSSLLHTIMDNIGVKSESQLLDKLEKTLKEHTDLQQSVVSLQTQLLHTTLQSISSPHHDVFDMIVVVDTYEHLQSVDFKDIVNATKQFFEQKNVLVYANSGNFALIMQKGNVSAKEYAQQHALRGGGSDTLLQGKSDKETLLQL